MLPQAKACGSIHHGFKITNYKWNYETDPYNGEMDSRKKYRIIDEYENILELYTGVYDPE